MAIGEKNVERSQLVCKITREVFDLSRAIVASNLNLNDYDALTIHICVTKEILSSSKDVRGNVIKAVEALTHDREGDATIKGIVIAFLDEWLGKLAEAD